MKWIPHYLKLKKEKKYFRILYKIIKLISYYLDHCGYLDYLENQLA